MITLKLTEEQALLVYDVLIDAAGYFPAEERQLPGTSDDDDTEFILKINGNEYSEDQLDNLAELINQWVEDSLP